MPGVNILLTKSESSNIYIRIGGIDALGRRPGETELVGCLTWSKPQLEREVGKRAIFLFPHP